MSKRGASVARLTTRMNATTATLDFGFIDWERLNAEAELTDVTGAGELGLSMAEQSNAP